MRPLYRQAWFWLFMSGQFSYLALLLLAGPPNLTRASVSSGLWAFSSLILLVAIVGGIRALLRIDAERPNSASPGVHNSRFSWTLPPFVEAEVHGECFDEARRSLGRTCQMKAFAVLAVVSIIWTGGALWARAPVASLLSGLLICSALTYLTFRAWAQRAFVIGYRQALVRRGRCPGCGYRQVSTNTGRCSECGLAFDE